PTENQFTAEAFAWLLHSGTAQVDSAVTWIGDDQARLGLSPSTSPTWVLFKESFAPGWSAELQWPDSPGVHSGTRSIPLVAGEADFMLARLDSVPAEPPLFLPYVRPVSDKAPCLVPLPPLAGFQSWLVVPAPTNRRVVV